MPQRVHNVPGWVHNDQGLRRCAFPSSLLLAPRLPSSISSPLALSRCLTLSCFRLLPRAPPLVSIAHSVNPAGLVTAPHLPPHPPAQAPKQSLSETPCFPGVQCLNLSPSGRTGAPSFACSACPVGFAGNGSVCYPCPLRVSIPYASFNGGAVPRAHPVTLFGDASAPATARGFACSADAGLSFEWSGEVVGKREIYPLGFDQQAFGRTLLLPPRFLKADAISRFRLRVCYTNNPMVRPARQAHARTTNSGTRAGRRSSVVAAPGFSQAGCLMRRAPPSRRLPSRARFHRTRYVRRLIGTLSQNRQRWCGARLLQRA